MSPLHYWQFKLLLTFDCTSPSLKVLCSSSTSTLLTVFHFCRSARVSELPFHRYIASAAFSTPLFISLSLSLSCSLSLSLCRSLYLSLPASKPSFTHSSLIFLRLSRPWSLYVGLGLSDMIYFPFPSSFSLSVFYHTVCHSIF